MHTRIAWFLSLLVILFTSCSIFKSVPKNAQVVFNKTACYGTCPIYKLTIDRKGKATFEGQRFTEKLGIWEKQLDKAEIKSLFKLMSSVQWDSMAKEYPAYVSDLPSTVYHFTYKKIDKEVVVTGKHPSIFDTLSTRLNNIAMSDNWLNLNVK